MRCGGYALWRLRADAISNGYQVSALHARSFENFLTQSLRVTELAAANTLPSDGKAIDFKQIESNFLNTLRHTPFLRSMSLQDDTGRILASSNPANVGIVVDTQTYLPKADQQQDILRMGQPWAGRDFSTGRATSPLHPALPDEQSFIPITQALQSNSHELHLLIALNPDYFLNHMVGALSAEKGLVEIIRYDGSLLISSDPEASVGSVHDYVVRDFVQKEIDQGTFENSNSDMPAALRML
jgi:hypothetical protein